MSDFGFSLLCYCVSDLSVAEMVRGFGVDSLFSGALYGVCSVNILSGIAMGFFLRGGVGVLKGVIPFAGAWGAKQFFLYACYALVGPVLGNVILSLRGPLAMLISYIMIRMGLKHAEFSSHNARIRKWLAIILMMTAVILYTAA